MGCDQSGAEQESAQLAPGSMQAEMAIAASDAGPALGAVSDGSRPPGAAKIADLHGPSD